MKKRSSQSSAAVASADGDILMKNKLNLILVFLILAVPAVLHGQLFQDGAGWNLDRLDSRVLAWDGRYSYPATGAGVTVYVLDGGVVDQPEFEGRLTVPKSEKHEGCLLDHGTMVAGLVGSRTFGTAKGVLLVSRQIYCVMPPQVRDVVQAMRTVKKECRNKRCVANLSFSYHPDVDTAAQELADAGIPVVWAAGNSPLCNPFGGPGVISVSAVDQGDHVMDFANPCADIFAGGNGARTIWIDGSMVAFGGTSAAAPQVAGLAAVYLELHPTASAAEVESALVANATLITGGLLVYSLF